MSENKSRDLAFIDYTNKTIFPASVNRLDFNGGYDSRDKEVEELRELVSDTLAFLKHDYSLLALQIKEKAKELLNDTRR